MISWQAHDNKWYINCYHLQESRQDICSSAIAKKIDHNLRNASNFHFIELWLMKLMHLMYHWTKKK